MTPGAQGGREGVAQVKLVVGLGNPGPEYRFSPHNLGFAVVERLAGRHAVSLARQRAHSRYGRFALGPEEVWLIQPQTFMNRSGVAVKEWLEIQDCGPEELLILADDLDLPWGKIRIRQRGSSGGHHGLESIIEAIGARQFTRLRIGVSPEGELEDPVRYLLEPIPPPQRPQVEAMVDRAADAAEMIVREGAPKAMNRINRRDSAAEPAASPPSAKSAKQEK